MRYIIGALAALGLLLAFPVAAQADHEIADTRLAESTQQYSSTGWGCHDGAPDYGDWDGYVAVGYEVVAEHEYEVVPTTADLPHAPGNLNGYSVHNGQTPQQITLTVECVKYAEHVEPELCEWDPELTVADEACVEPEPEPEPTETSEPTEDPTSEPTDDTTPVAKSETLPNTGSSLLWVAGAGIALVLAGGALALRRRTQ